MKYIYTENSDYFYVILLNDFHGFKAVYSLSMLQIWMYRVDQKSKPSSCHNCVD